MTTNLMIEWQPGRSVSARLAGPERSPYPALLLAHGAGAGQDHPGVAGLRDRLAGAGIPVLTFNYPYIEVGKRRPDPPARLLECHRAALNWLRSERGGGVVAAGRSMGGRMATYLAAEGEDVHGLVLYAYPLHPPGKPDRLRADHLVDIAVPMLFFSGTRDSFARVDLIDRHLRTLPGATIEMIEDADHSFRVPKRSGRTNEQVLDEIAARTVVWIEAVLLP